RDHELDPNPDLVIVHTLPMDCATVLAKVEEAQGLLPERTKLVAYTTWEGASAIPMAMAQSLHVDFDQIWVPSKKVASYVAQGLAATMVASADSVDIANRKTKVVAHAFDPAVLPAWRRPNEEDDRPRPYRFYYVGAWNSRKNP